MKIYNMTSSNGNRVPNQFIIEDDHGSLYFQSYQTIIAKKERNNNGVIITLDRNAWDYSVTTGKYRNLFLGETKAETLRKIKDGTYRLENLN